MLWTSAQTPHRHHHLPEGLHLEQQAIPRAAVSNCTNHFSVVNTLRESGFDSACSIEGFQLFGGEFHIQTGEIILELRYLPRSNNRDYWHRLMAQPGGCKRPAGAGGGQDGGGEIGGFRARPGRLWQEKLIMARPKRLVILQLNRLINAQHIKLITARQQKLTPRAPHVERFSAGGDEGMVHPQPPG